MNIIVPVTILTLLAVSGVKYHASETDSPQKHKIKMVLGSVLIAVCWIRVLGL